MEWITIKQACQISGKSESSIRRLIRKSKGTQFDYSGDDRLNGHEQLPNQDEQIYMTRLACQKKRAIWLVDKGSLIHICNVGFDDDLSNDQSSDSSIDNHDHSNDHVSGQSEIIRMLQENNEYLKTQIAELHRQIEQLHILLGHQQRQLPAPGKKTGFISGILARYGL